MSLLISQINKAKEREDGFTLIEILVAVLIVGILAAIAVPVFLNQRKKANDAVAQSDLKNAITVTETYFVDNPDVDKVDLAEIRKMMRKDSQVRLTWTGNYKDYCIEAQHVNSAVFTPNWVFPSKVGGSPVRASQNTMSCSNYGANTYDTHVIWNTGTET